MSLSMHQVSIPVFQRGLETLSALLRKGEEHALAAGTDPAALIGARLAPDMFPLSGQVQRASDTAKLAAARLTGTEAPSFADEESTFAELQQRIGRTADYLNGVHSGLFEGSETREITIRPGNAPRSFSGVEYVLTFALPNFFFHVTTAYDILRHNGVAIGKRDYLWPNG